MRAGLYGRVSTLDQHVDNQLEELRRYVQARGWTVAQEYVDRGVSGAKDSRPALNRLREAARRRQSEFGRVLKAAGVRTIKCHGLRHTSATLLLAAGESVHVVSARLGHAKVTTTLETYAHALPSHGKAAAARLGAILHGAG